MKTEILKIDTESDVRQTELERAADVIKRGGLVVFPTETVYGLGADATSADAAGKIYSAKGRPSDNPLIIHVSRPSEAEKYTYTDEVYYKLAERFMPGPLTVILPSKDSIPKTTRGGLDTVAVRCPAHPIANELIRLSGVPIAAPSANLSGSPSPTTFGHAFDDMFGRVDMIIDGGDCDFGLESTIVTVNGDGSVTLLRPGKITVEDLESVGLTVHVAEAVTDKLKDGEIALSPGMKYRHYAPKAPLILLDCDADSALEYMLKNNKNDKIAILCYGEDVALFRDKIPGAKLYDFGEKDDEFSQAHRLFFELREADKEDFDIIFAPLPKRRGIGLALYNRMIRAAAHKIIKL